jgi:tetratricopeptide (TPR) repeat protein
MMQLAILILAVSLSLPGWLQRFTRETNSRAASAKGVREYNLKHYGPAAGEFAKANELHPSALSAFDLGTSQVAAGKNEDGSHALAKAIEDPGLRERALYNRGNSALSAKAFDAAVRDYSAALRLHPGDMQAKRNLEIALRQDEKQKEQKKQQEQKQGGPKGQEPQNAGGKGSQNQGQNGPKPGPEAGQSPQQQAGGAKDQSQQQTADSILRAIQQQESEELTRMKQVRAQGQKAGW